MKKIIKILMIFVTGFTGYFVLSGMYADVERHMYEKKEEIRKRVMDQHYDEISKIVNGK